MFVIQNETNPHVFMVTLTLDEFADLRYKTPIDRPDKAETLKKIILEGLDPDKT